MLGNVFVVGAGNVGFSLASTANKTIVHDDWEEYLDELKKRDPVPEDGIPDDEYDLIILAVHEADLVTMVPQLKEALMGDWKRRVYVHTNGIAGPEILYDLHAAGVSVGVLHPFQTFGADLLPRIKGIGWGVECDDVAWPVIFDYVKELNGNAYRFYKRNREQRLQYHAAAVAASNLTYASIDLARHLGRDVRISTVDFIIPIVKQTLENAMDYMEEGDGLEEFPVTGPLVRGETAIVVEQMKALPETDRMSYALLSLALLERIEATQINANLELRAALIEEINRK